MENPRLFFVDPRIDKPWGEYSKGKATRTVRLRYTNRGAKERQQVPTQRGGLRKAREATTGVMLDRMTKAMGRTLPVTVVEGNLRPHDPMQAAKFASEAGVIV